MNRIQTHKTTKNMSHGLYATNVFINPTIVLAEENQTNCRARATCGSEASKKCPRVTGKRGTFIFDCKKNVAESLLYAKTLRKLTMDETFGAGRPSIHLKNKACKNHKKSSVQYKERSRFVCQSLKDCAK